MADEKKLKLKLSLKKETLRELDDSRLDVLDQVVGGTCPCTWYQGRTVALVGDNDGAARD